MTLDVSAANKSSAKIPGLLALCRPYEKKYSLSNCSMCSNKSSSTKLSPVVVGNSTVIQNVQVQNFSVLLSLHPNRGIRISCGVRGSMRISRGVGGIDILWNYTIHVLMHVACYIFGTENISIIFYLTYCM